MLMGLIAGCAWILAKREWDSRDRSNPQKAFLLEVGASIKSDAQHLWLSSLNGRKRDGHEGRNGGSRGKVSAVAEDSLEAGKSSIESSNS
jgi:hypothetical protein